VYVDTSPGASNDYAIWDRRDDSNNGALAFAIGDYATDTTNIKISTANSGTWFNYMSDSQIPLDTWTFIAVVYDGTSLNFYMDDGYGSLAADGTTAYNTPNSVNLPQSIGKMGGLDGHYFDGFMDELRVSNTIRNTCWITTEFNNEYSYTDFYSKGTEESAGSGLADITQVRYRWRNDDGVEGGLDTGDGADGSISLSVSTGDFNLNTTGLGGRSYPDGVAYRVKDISGTGITLGNATDTTLSNTNGIAAGDEILLINLQGSSGDNGDVGNYEFLEVSSVSGGVITVGWAPVKTYDGSGNSFSTQKVFVKRVLNYTTVTTNAYSITASAWDGGADHDDSSCTDNLHTGIVVFRATGAVTVSASGSIDMSGLCFSGGGGA